MVIDKAVALVVRPSDRGRELLVFRHPLAGLQVPKGTVEPGEPTADAVLRELHEESGLAFECRPRAIGHWDRVLEGGEVHRWHLFLIDAPDGFADEWTHEATGSVEEEGLDFAFHWLPLDAGLPGSLEPLFAPCAEALLAAQVAGDGA